MITSFFNPAEYDSKKRNFDQFIGPIRDGGLNWMLAECAFGDAPFCFEASLKVFRVRSRSVLWQKERLLNHVVRQLPASCTKIAWVDADVLFTNPDWAVETSLALEQFPLVQPYSEVIRLPPRTRVYRGEGRVWPSFAARRSENPSSLYAGKFDAHGHTGFAWAARRELLLEPGLYDACIAGGGDHFMAHAAAGDWSTTCALRVTGGRSALYRHASGWARRWHSAVQREIGWVDGTLLHLWHGDFEHRQYNLRGHELTELGFDPARDLRIGKNGCWEWATHDPALRQWAVDYFAARHEDGAASRERISAASPASATSQPRRRARMPSR